MKLDDAARSFLEAATSAAMITLRRDGSPHSVRVGLAVVDGKLWSSGTHSRARTAHLRRDPRCNLFVFNPDAGPLYLGLDTTVTILDGPDVGAISLRMFRRMQGIDTPDTAHVQISWFGATLSDQQFEERMGAEGRLVYEFDVLRAYGTYAPA